MKLIFKLIEVENKRSLDIGTDSEFIYLIQHAALLGLKDAGLITEMEHRNTEQIIIRQYRTYTNKLPIEKNEID